MGHFLIEDFALSQIKSFWSSPLQLCYWPLESATLQSHSFIKKNQTK